MKILLQSWRGYALLLLAQCMVGVCIVGSKSLLSETPPITILNIRFLIAFIFLLIIHLSFSKNKITPLRDLSARDWFFIVVQALCTGAFF